MTGAQPEVEEIAKAVGFAISAWGEIESIMCSIYAAALRVPVYVTARDAFYSIISFQGKVKTTDVCFKREFVGDLNLLAEWAAFKKESVKLSIHRNELAHGSVMVVNTEPPTPGWFPFWNGSAIEGTLWVDGHVVVVDKKKFHYYTSAQIRQFREDFAAVASQGEKLFQKAAAKLHEAGKSWNIGK